MTPNLLMELATEIHESNCTAGWWDDPARCLFECLQLISTEVAEATEGERKDLMDDHLPHRKMAEVELADALIRTLDLCGRLSWFWVIAPDVKPISINSGYSRARTHLLINSYIIVVAEDLELAIANYDPEVAPVNLFAALTDLIRIIIAVADRWGYDLLGALLEKMTYNKTREDHKRENRALPGGKKF